MTDPAGCSPGHAHRDLPALMSRVLAANLLRDLVADLVVLGHLVTLLVGPVLVVVVIAVAGVGVVTLLPVLHHLLAVLPVDLLAVRLVHLVTLLPVASLLDGVVLDPASHVLLVLPVAVMAVAGHGGHDAQDNLQEGSERREGGRDTHEKDERLHDSAAGRLLSRTDLHSSQVPYL